MFNKHLTKVLLFLFVPVISIYLTYGQNASLVVFDFDGSSSMRPIIEFLFNEYKKTSTDSKNTFANISNTGSNSALRKILNGDIDFALVSHDISADAKSLYNSRWSSQKLKTITLAKDAIVVLYKKPKGCQEDLVINQENIREFFSLFSGYVYENLKTNLKDFTPDKSDACSAELKVWVKNVGPSKSGTSKAFVNNPLLKNACNQKGDTCQTWLKKVKGSGYGNQNPNLYYALESNALHWESFFNHLDDGSITYMPSHFVFLNQGHLKKAGISIAKMKIGDEILDLNTDNYSSIINKWRWGRTFNLIYSVNKLTNERKNMLLGLTKEISKLKNMKLIPISDEYKDSDISVADVSSGKYGVALSYVGS